MKQTIKIKNICIGEGVPKVCAPIVGRTKEEIFQQAKKLSEVSPDLIEWRVDWFDTFKDYSAVLSVLKELNKIISKIPLLFTFRTKGEGGEMEIAFEDYFQLNIEAAKSRYVDLIDVELFMGDKVELLIQKLQQEAIPVVVSNHDFQKTPTKEEMLSRLQRMDTLGADILKIAVMPKSKKDVLTLLEVTNEMREAYTNKPLITIAMEKSGVISRIAGEIFGSDVTFGAAERASAPGQITVGKLRDILQTIHEITI